MHFMIDRAEQNVAYVISDLCIGVGEWAELRQGVGVYER